MTLANEGILHTTLLQEVTTTTTTTGKPTHEWKEWLSGKFNTMTLPDLSAREVWRSDWLPGKDAMVTM